MMFVVVFSAEILFVSPFILGEDAEEISREHDSIWISILISIWVVFHVNLERFAKRKINDNKNVSFTIFKFLFN